MVLARKCTLTGPGASPEKGSQQNGAFQNQPPRSRTELLERGRGPPKLLLLLGPQPWRLRISSTTATLGSGR